MSTGFIHSVCLGNLRVSTVTFGAVPGASEPSSSSISAHWKRQEVANRKERNEQPSPSLEDQLLSLIGDPGASPMPECGGLAICPED